MFTGSVRSAFVGERNYGAILNEQSLTSYVMDCSALQKRAGLDILSCLFL